MLVIKPGAAGSESKYANQSAMLPPSHPISIDLMMNSLLRKTLKMKQSSLNSWFLFLNKNNKFFDNSTMLFHLLFLRPATDLFKMIYVFGDQIFKSFQRLKNSFDKTIFGLP